MWTSALPPIDKQSRVPRKRAPVACVSCRRRKVRCDVARNGIPCSNCRLDDEDCSVLSRRARYRNGIKSTEVQDPMTNLDGSALDVANVSTQPLVSTPSPDVRATAAAVYESNRHRSTESGNSASLDLLLEPIIAELNNPGVTEGGIEHDGNDLTDNVELPLCASPEAQPFGGCGPCYSTSLGSTDTLYMHHEFLTHNDLSHLLVRDFELLEAQGCLRVPHRDILDEFVRQYFLFIHPTLPVLDEADFWRTYCGQGPSRSTISLLLLQSMMFAACSCVSRETICSLGFASAREARLDFYRKAKMLHDMNAECCSAAIAQSALLLTYWTPPGELKGRKPNASWLAVAILHARNEKAHLHQLWPMDNSRHKERSLWKKIWWCCIIRDAVMALGLRRSPQITRGDFDFESSKGPIFRDFEDDVSYSRVYTRGNKTVLVRLLIGVTDLCVILTRLQALSPWLEDPQQRTQKRLISNLNDLKQVKALLREWYDRINAEFLPCFGNLSLTSSDGGAQSKAIALHIQTMYMYYYSASTTLLHHEILLVTLAAPKGSPYQVLRSGYTSTLFDELKGITQKISESMNDLVRLEMIQFLPISAPGMADPDHSVAFLAIPLVHHILGLQATSDDSKLSAENRCGRLNTLIGAIKILQRNYHGVEWVSSVLKRALLASPSVQSQGTETALKTFGIEESPLIYLYIAHIVDFSLSQSRHMEESDVPACLTDESSSTASDAASSTGQSQSSEDCIPDLKAPLEFISADHGILSARVDDSEGRLNTPSVSMSGIRASFLDHDSFMSALHTNELSQASRHEEKGVVDVIGWDMDCLDALRTDAA